jgi:hypothetical protein
MEYQVFIKPVLFLALWIFVFILFYKQDKKGIFKNFSKESFYSQSLAFRTYFLLLILIFGTIYMIFKEIMRGLND